MSYSSNLNSTKDNINQVYTSKIHSKWCMIFMKKIQRKIERFLEFSLNFTLKKKNEMISLKILVHYKIFLFVITYNN